MTVIAGTGNGNVGIGTTSPGAKLDVAGSAPVIRLTDTRSLNVGDWDDVSLGKIQFYTSDTTSPGARALAEVEAYSGAAYFVGITPLYQTPFLHYQKLIGHILDYR